MQAVKRNKSRWWEHTVLALDEKKCSSTLIYTFRTCIYPLVSSYAKLMRNFVSKSFPHSQKFKSKRVFSPHKMWSLIYLYNSLRQFSKNTKKVIGSNFQTCSQEIINKSFNENKFQLIMLFCRNFLNNLVNKWLEVVYIHH